MSGTANSGPSEEVLARARACDVGLREWGVVCAAVAAGRQRVLLRKGGLADRSGRFAVEHEVFWLLPSTFHPERSAVRDEAAGLWEAATGLRDGERVELPAFVEVVAAERVDDERELSRLAGGHVLTEAMVATRFAYREPGLVVLTVRAYRPAPRVFVEETEAMRGCRSWVPLGGVPGFEALEVVEGDAFAKPARGASRG